MGDVAHWDDHYQSIGAEAVSWYELHPTVSLEMLRVAGVTAHDSIIDIGGGSSALVDELLAHGHTDVTVLDLSTVALDAARLRLDDPTSVTWHSGDLLTWRPARRWDVWHDRAVLHFLADDDDRHRYLDQLQRCLGRGGVAVIGAFAEDGPAHCSALPVRRYTPEDLAALLADGFDIVDQRRDVHRTPAGTEQPFNWIAARRRPEPRETST